MGISFSCHAEEEQTVRSELLVSFQPLKIHTERRHQGSRDNNRRTELISCACSNACKKTGFPLLMQRFLFVTGYEIQIICQKKSTVLWINIAAQNMPRTRHTLCRRDAVQLIFISVWRNVWLGRKAVPHLSNSTPSEKGCRIAEMGGEVASLLLKDQMNLSKDTLTALVLPQRIARIHGTPSHQVIPQGQYQVLQLAAAL